MPQLATRIDGPLAVIGDLHGQVEKLLVVLENLRSLPDYDRRWLVFLGDFVDRGPDPKAALDVVTDLLIEHPRTTAIAGNHDLAMAASLGCVPTPEYSNWAQRWLEHYDAATTFESYGVDFGNIDELAEAVPPAHRDFLGDLPWCVEHPRYLFVHAGIDSNTPFDVQLRILRQRDFTLTRPQWLCSKSLVGAEVPADCPFTVVSGHVCVPQVQFGHKRILADTTGGTGGELSCLLLPEKKVISSASEVAIAGSKSWWKIW